MDDVPDWAKDAATEILSRPAKMTDVKFYSTPNESGYSPKEIDMFNAANRKSIKDKIIEKMTATNNAQEPQKP